MNLGCMLPSSLRMGGAGTVGALRNNQNGGHSAEGPVSSDALTVGRCLYVGG